MLCCTLGSMQVEAHAVWWGSNSAQHPPLLSLQGGRGQPGKMAQAGIQGSSPGIRFLKRKAFHVTPGTPVRMPSGTNTCGATSGCMGQAAHSALGACYSRDARGGAS